MAGNLLRLLCFFISTNREGWREHPRESGGFCACLRLVGTQMSWRSWAETVRGIISSLLAISKVQVWPWRVAEWGGSNKQRPETEGVRPVGRKPACFIIGGTELGVNTEYSCRVTMYSSSADSGEATPFPGHSVLPLTPQHWTKSGLPQLQPFTSYVYHHNPLFDVWQVQLFNIAQYVSQFTFLLLILKFYWNLAYICMCVCVCVCVCVCW